MDYMGILATAAKTIWKDKVIYAFQLVFMSIVPLLILPAVGIFIFFLDAEHPERIFSIFDHPLNTENLPIPTFDLSYSVGLAGDCPDFSSFRSFAILC